MRVTPQASVIVPVHDAANTLAEQLDALDRAAAAAPPVEVLVVDNGSTDGSAETARRWARDHRLDLRVVDASARPGEPYARNVGLAAARASKVLYCDADDRVGPRWITALLDALATAPFATGPIDTRALNPAWLADLRGSSVAGRSTIGGVVPYAHGCNMAFDRATLAALGGFDERYLAGCDLDIAVRFHRAGHTMAFADDAVVHYRLRPGVRATWRQGVSYGRYRMPVLARLATDGIVPTSRPHPDRRSLWLARHAPAALLRRADRARWAWVAAQLWGERHAAVIDPSAPAPGPGLPVGATP